MQQIIIMQFYKKWEYFYSFVCSVIYLVLLLPPAWCGPLAHPYGPLGGLGPHVENLWFKLMFESILHLVVWLFFLSFLVQIYIRAEGLYVVSLQCSPFVLEHEEFVTVGCPSFH